MHTVSSLAGRHRVRVVQKQSNCGVVWEAAGCLLGIVNVLAGILICRCVRLVAYSSCGEFALGNFDVGK